MNIYGFKKGMILTAGISFLTIAIECVKNKQYELAIALGFLGFGLLSLFTYLTESQATERVIAYIKKKEH